MYETAPYILIVEKYEGPITFIPKNSEKKSEIKYF
jgi:hypothetical protein